MSVASGRHSQQPVIPRSCSRHLSIHPFLAWFAHAHTLLYNHTYIPYFLSLTPNKPKERTCVQTYTHTAELSLKSSCPREEYFCIYFTSFLFTTILFFLLQFLLQPFSFSPTHIILALNCQCHVSSVVCLRIHSW